VFALLYFLYSCESQPRGRYDFFARHQLDREAESEHPFRGACRKWVAGDQPVGSERDERRQLQYSGKRFGLILSQSGTKGDQWPFSRDGSERIKMKDDERR